MRYIVVPSVPLLVIPYSYAKNYPSLHITSLAYVRMSINVAIERDTLCCLMFNDGKNSAELIIRRYIVSSSRTS